jgi:hypothetical protein
MSRPSSRWFRGFIILISGLSASIVLGAEPASASPSATPAPTAKVDCVAFDSTGACSVKGVVYAMAQLGGRTYVGGSFASVSGTPRANVAAIRADGTLDPAWNPSTDGIVYAIAVSSDGSKVFLGGAFTAVGGVSRSRLAAVTPDTGTPLATWTTVASNNNVRALAADGADRLYVGGNFGGIGGRTIPRLAAVSQSTGAVDRGFVPQPNNTIRALTLSDDGTQLFAGGSFTTIGGAGRPGLAQLDTVSGAALATFVPSNGGVVIALDETPGGRVFASTTNNRTWAYDVSAGGVLAYVVRTSGDVQAILATDDEVYVGGHFTSFPEVKQSRSHLGSFLTANGQVTAWNPGVNGNYGVWAIGLTRTALSPDAVPALSIGGDFTQVNGLARRGYARFLF